jgi:hypothetical protein
VVSTSLVQLITGFWVRRGAEAVGLADDPGGQRPAARSRRSRRGARVDEALGDGGVHHAHQVVVVVAGIVAVDLVGEASP